MSKTESELLIRKIKNKKTLGKKSRISGVFPKKANFLQNIF